MKSPRRIRSSSESVVSPAHNSTTADGDTQRRTRKNSSGITATPLPGGDSPTPKKLEEGSFTQTKTKPTAQSPRVATPEMRSRSTTSEKVESAKRSLSTKKSAKKTVTETSPGVSSPPIKSPVNASAEESAKNSVKKNGDSQQTSSSSARPTPRRKGSETNTSPAKSPRRALFEADKSPPSASKSPPSAPTDNHGIGDGEESVSSDSSRKKTPFTPKRGHLIETRSMTGWYNDYNCELM
jgi:hypothetical protein